ncbi:MAG: GyrI-like domain-containing protein [Clostridia bacterium]
MKIEACVKECFTVIGKQGSTDEGTGFIARLWADANAHFDEVAPFAKRDENGQLLGLWGAMSDASLAFQPWEDGFTRGLYLAGVECADGAEAPPGWTKWRIPGYEYLFVENDAPDVFTSLLAHLHKTGIALAGAVHDFHCPATGKDFMFFPVRRL